MATSFASVRGKLPTPGTHTGARRILVAEFVISTLIVGLSPLTDKHKTDPPAAYVKRVTALALLYVGLGLASTGGRGASKIAAAFGGLVTLALLVSARDVFTVIAQRFTEAPETGPAGPPDAGEGGGIDPGTAGVARSGGLVTA